jgi:Tol biopolymer transport system component
MARVRTNLLLAATVFAVAVSPLAPAPAGARARKGLVSVARDGGAANGPSPALSVSDTTSPQMALDGASVAFSSDASNLVPDDRNGVADVFVRDLGKRRTVRVSVSSSGAQGNGPSHSPAISVDGTIVAFVSEATNLVPGDTNGTADIFVRDLSRAKTKRVSIGPSGRQANGPSSMPALSLFGRWVTFDSAATNLAKNDENNHTDAFYHDRGTGRTRRLAPPGSIDPGTDVAWTTRASISYDGKVLTFLRQVARASEVGATSATDEPYRGDVFVQHRGKGSFTRRVKLTPRDNRYRYVSDAPLVAADGRWVTFTAQSVLDPDSIGRTVDRIFGGLGKSPTVDNPLDQQGVFLYDTSGKYAPLGIARNFYGNPPLDGPSTWPSIASQGHAVAFSSDATNVVAGDTNAASDIFVWDSHERSTSRASMGPRGVEPNGASSRPTMSYEARYIAFASTASNLVPDDTNAVSDIFWHDRLTHLPNGSPRFGPRRDVKDALDAQGRPMPNIRRLREVLSINPAESTRLSLRARDPDRDRLRFGILQIVPPNLPAGPHPSLTGMAIDPRSGVFTWTPAPHQTGPWHVIFWVMDARGRADALWVEFAVRNARQVAECRLDNTC